MIHLQRLMWTLLTCGSVMKSAANFHLYDFLPPLVILVAYPSLFPVLLDETAVFLTAYLLGEGTRLWLNMPMILEGFKRRGFSAWLVPLVPLAIMAFMLVLQSPAAALRVVYLYTAVRLLALLLDLSDDGSAVMVKLFDDPGMRQHYHALTRIFILRDIAMILLVETVIALGALPPMLVLLAFWNMLHRFVDRVAAISVVLVRRYDGAD